jgi:hypothetical protein
MKAGGRTGAEARATGADGNESHEFNLQWLTLQQQQ